MELWNLVSSISSFLIPGPKETALALTLFLRSESKRPISLELEPIKAGTKVNLFSC